MTDAEGWYPVATFDGTLVDDYEEANFVSQALSDDATTRTVETMDGEYTVTLEVSASDGPRWVPVADFDATDIDVLSSVATDLSESDEYRVTTGKNGETHLERKVGDD